LLRHQENLDISPPVRSASEFLGTLPRTGRSSKEKTWASKQKNRSTSQLTAGAPSSDRFASQRRRWGNLGLRLSVLPGTLRPRRGSTFPPIMGNGSDSHDSIPCWPKPGFFGGGAGITGRFVMEVAEKGAPNGPPNHRPPSETWLGEGGASEVWDDRGTLLDRFQRRSRSSNSRSANDGTFRLTNRGESAAPSRRRYMYFTLYGTWECVPANIVCCVCWLVAERCEGRSLHTWGSGSAGAGSASHDQTDPGVQCARGRLHPAGRTNGAVHHSGLRV